MFFICNNSLLFNPETHAISPVGQPESVLTLSAPAARLLQEFIRNKGCDLSREELITRVWEAYGFTPSGNNLNKAVSELRKSFQVLGECQEMIVTLPRYGFRFDAEVISHPKLLFAYPTRSLQRFPYRSTVKYRKYGVGLVSQDGQVFSCSLLQL